MEKIKAVIFDAGVLIKEDAEKARHIISVKFGLNEEKFKEYAIKNLTNSYKGALNYNDFFKNLIKEQGISANSENLAIEWVKARNRFSKINNSLLKEIRKLKNKYLFGIIANSTILNDRAVARKRVYKLFPFKIISYLVKKVKPDKEIFELLISKLKKNKVKPEEILFVTIKEKNIEPAKNLGIQTYLFFENKELINKLNER
jgi:putative hydrolase of the HAD superfamily